MRVLNLLGAFLFGLTLVAAGAEELRVTRQEFRPDPAVPETLVFTVTVEKAGSYAAQLLVRAEEGKEHTLQLILHQEGLAAEDLSAAPIMRFSFTGQGCG
jgi:hypothetical protein